MAEAVFRGIFLYSFVLYAQVTEELLVTKQDGKLLFMGKTYPFLEKEALVL